MVLIGEADPVPMENLIKTRKSICKITYGDENSSYGGTGFFMTIANSLRYLVTCKHVVDIAIEKKSIIRLEICDIKLYQLELNARSIKILEPLDIAAIEIKDSDNICQDIEFLEYDKEYINYGYSIYKEKNLFLVGYCRGVFIGSTGTIKNLDNEYQFFHTMSVRQGSSGSPILLYSNYVIGIHIGGDISRNLNFGTFIGELIKEFDIPNQLNLGKNSQSMDKNKIFPNINNSKINNKGNNSEINTNINNSKINTNINSSKINTNINNSKINNKGNNSKINTIINNSKINNNINNSKINTNTNNSKINNKSNNSKINTNVNKNINNSKNKNINNIKDSSSNNNNIINNKIELTLDLTKSQKITNNIKEY